MHSNLRPNRLHSKQTGASVAIAIKVRSSLALIVINGLFQLLFFLLYRPYIDSRDMSENYVWGSVWSLGNNKHPPLFGWVTHLWFDLFPTADWANYLLNEVNLLLAFVFLRLALRKVFDEEKTFIALALTMLVMTIGIPFNYQYNANSAQFPFLAAYVWALLATLTDRRNSWYGLAGMFAGAAILCKYSAILLILPISVLLWLYYKPRFAEFLPRIMFAGAVALAVLSPHIYWGMQHHWPSLGYMEKHAIDTSAHYFAVIPDRLQRILIDAAVPLLMLSVALSTLGKSVQNASKAPSPVPRLGLAIFVCTILCVFIGAFIEQLRPDPEWFIVCMLFFGWAMVDILPKNIHWHLLKARIQSLLVVYCLLVTGFVGYSMASSERLYPPMNEIPELLAKDITAFYHATYHQRIAYAAGSYPLAYDLAFYSADHPYGVYQLDVRGSSWINLDKFKSGSKVVVCSTEKRDYIKDPACTQQALSVLGQPDSRKIFEYQAYDPHKHAVRRVRYSILMYRER